jgi:hypothetical protein
MLQLLSFYLLLTGFLGDRVREPNCPKTGERPGFYSKLGIILCFQDVDNEIRHLEIPSPDGSDLLVVDGYDGKFTKNGKQVGHSFKVARDEEVIWSPDSTALIFTTSYGGLGPVVAGVGYVHKHGPEVPDVTKPIQKDFAARHRCGPCCDDVNVGGLAWEEGSKRAIFIAEVPSSSSCGDMLGYFEAYVVSIPQGQILARYPKKDAVKRWRKVLARGMLDD